MFGIVWYVLLIILTLIGLNIIIDYKRYGKKIFDCFRKRNNELDMNSLIVNIFKREIRDQVLILERSSDYFIAVTKFDIFLVQIIKERENVFGNITDEVLQVNKVNIKNPLLQMIKETNLLLKNNFLVRPLIIKTNNDCVLNLHGLDKRYVCSLEDFSYLLYKLQHSTFRYSEKDIQNIVVKIKELLDGNNQD